MQYPYELLLGWRYTRAGRSSQRNGFISFIAGASMLGIALGVAALIIVLSVMNGFQKEVTDRMLSVVSHIEVLSADGQAMADPQQVLRVARQLPELRGAAPFVMSQALLARGADMKGVLLRGIDPLHEGEVSDLAAGMQEQLRRQLVAGERGIVLGVELARALGVRAGDTVTLALPGGQVSPAGVLPRFVALKVTGTFDSGHYEYDSAMALLHIDDAQRLLRLEGPTGVRLRVQDMYQAPAVAHRLALTLPEGLLLRDWTQQNRTWYAAVQVEKRMMFIILTLIVAVAAFNLVSTLVMTVQDKRSDIAILRTLGASPASIMGIFVVQGAAVGVLGTLAGAVLGLGVALNIDVIVPAIEHALSASFIPKDIYFINHMPSDPRMGDILPVVLVSLLLAFVATLYPSWRASRVQPAEALRYE